MIHVIQHHIGKGSYTAWYDIIKFKNPVTYYHFDNQEQIEGKHIGNPPYVDILEQQIKDINPQNGDYVFFDAYYILNYRTIDEIKEYVEELSKKHNNCKFVLFDGDNQLEYCDTERYTFFSNKFDVSNKNLPYQDNCNYYQYRMRYQKFLPHLDWFVEQFKNNIRQKKMNMIIGADKIFRLQVFRYAYRIGLDKDSWMSYSGFSKSYDDSELSSDLLKFKKEKLPVILDTPFEWSCIGSVNVEKPPLPITSTSYVSAICETQIFIGDMVHLSEKSYNPFVSKSIPLILGSSKLNTFLKSYGYWMADDLFDLSEQQDYAGIISQYCRNLDVINKMSLEDLHNYYQENLGRIEGNYHRIINNEFLFDEYKYKRPIKCL
jgi:hypothetical protein